jgi:hypothetical protein
MQFGAEARSERKVKNSLCWYRLRVIRPTSRKVEKTSRRSFSLKCFQTSAELGQQQIHVSGSLVWRKVWLYPEDGGSRFLQSTNKHKSTRSSQKQDYNQNPLQNIYRQRLTSSNPQASISFYLQPNTDIVSCQQFSNTPDFFSVCSTKTTVYFVPRRFNVALSKIELLVASNEVPSAHISNINIPPDGYHMAHPF